jgi:hypothetical protein
MKAKLNYTMLANMAERITKMRNDRLRKMCKDAGLSPELLGIHPHNAMCDYPEKPWPEVDYKICKRLVWLQRTGWEWQAKRLVDKLYSAGRTNLN